MSKERINMKLILIAIMLVFITNGCGYKGVFYRKTTSKYDAIFNSNFICSFDNKVDAAIAYNNHVKKLFGDFAYLNKIPGETK